MRQPRDSWLRDTSKLLDVRDTERCSMPQTVGSVTRGSAPCRVIANFDREGAILEGRYLLKRANCMFARTENRV